MSEISAYLSTEWIKDYLLPIILAILSAWITTKLTVKNERTKMVNEVRRNTYMSALLLLNKLTQNPALIFDDTYMEKIQQSALEIEVYGSTAIQDPFISFIHEIQSRYYDYARRFRCDEERDELAKNPFFVDMLEEEEFNYTLENMPQFEDVKRVAETLKRAIAECLRKG